MSCLPEAKFYRVKDREYKISPYVAELFEELGLDGREFLEIMLEAPTYFRVNTLKVSLERFQEHASFEYKETPYKYGFEAENVKIGKTIEYFLGWLHPQNLSSMMPVIALNPREKTKIMDMAAAPGGKTSQIAQHVGDNASILAIDKNIDRISMLVSNLERLGVKSAAVMRADSRKIEYTNTFDYILLDAPCSSLGSSTYALSRTNKNRIRDMARVQRQLILKAFDALKEGGELVYSTCTVSPLENEAVVDYLLKNRENAEAIEVKLPIKYITGLKEYEGADKVARIYPWHVNSEAFFIAKIRKQDV